MTGFGFFDGLAHPLGGPDHFLAMVAVGILAAQMGGAARAALPLAFLAGMAGGAVLGALGVALPGVEEVIVGSVLFLGTVVALPPRLPVATASGLVAALALFHGHAHGAEMPELASPVAYAAGFLLTAGVLLAFGAAVGRVATRLSGPRMARACGVAIALGGGSILLH